MRSVCRQQSAVLLLLLFLCTFGAAGPDGHGVQAQPGPSSRQIEEIAGDLRARLTQRFTPAPQVTVNGGSINVAMRTREFQEHTRDRFGNWSSQMRTVVGPEAGGMHIVAEFGPDPNSGALVRPDVGLPPTDGPEADSQRRFIGARFRRPYFDVYVSKTDFLGDRGGMWVNIAVSEQNDERPREYIVWTHLQLLEACKAHGLVPAPPPDVQLPDAALAAPCSEQDRCDAFFRLFGAPEPRPIAAHPLPPRLHGLTTLRIAAILGQPQRIERQEHEGVEWLRIWYEFDTCPRDAPQALQGRFEQGWRYRVAILFRNRTAATPEEFAEAWGLERRSLVPANLGFTPSGDFP